MVIRCTRGGGSFPSLIGGGGPPFMEATGGTVTTSGDFKVHTFNSGGSFVVPVAVANTAAVVVLVEWLQWIQIY